MKGLSTLSESMALCHDIPSRNKVLFKSFYSGFQSLTLIWQCVKESLALSSKAVKKEVFGNRGLMSLRCEGGRWA